jgi:hypothetical protein
VRKPASIKDSHKGGGPRSGSFMEAGCWPEFGVLLQSIKFRQKNFAKKPFCGLMTMGPWAWSGLGLAGRQAGGAGGRAGGMGGAGGASAMSSHGWLPLRIRLWHLRLENLLLGSSHGHLYVVLMCYDCFDALDMGP